LAVIAIVQKVLFLHQNEVPAITRREEEVFVVALLDGVVINSVSSIGKLIDGLVRSARPFSKPFWQLSERGLGA
jgi:hypothetical protein